MAEEKKIYLYHHDRTVKTLKDFMDKERIKFVTLDDLWNENKDFIFSQMSLADKTAYKESNGKFPESGSDLSSGMTLPCPCKLRVNPHGITAEVAISQTNFQENTDDFYAFENEQIQDVLNDSRSVFVDKSNPEIQVIAWCKSQNLNSYFDKVLKVRMYEQKGFIDISRYIISAFTNIGSNGGSFTIKLPLVSWRSLYGVHNIVGSATVRNYDNSDEDLGGREKNWELSNKQFFSRNKFDNFANDDFFGTLFSSNDLIFISFHKEADFSKEGFEEIAGKNYDLIGLIDTVKTTKNSEGASGFVEITGRDLMKLLIDDGSFFFNRSVCANPQRVFINAESEDGNIFLQGDIKDIDSSINRLRGISNEIDVFRSPLNNKLDLILKAVISQLANIRVVPDEVFFDWSNKTTWNELQPEKEEN